jgi:hypothetical protein
VSSCVCVYGVCGVCVCGVRGVCVWCVCGVCVSGVCVCLVCVHVCGVCVWCVCVSGVCESQSNRTEGLTALPRSLLPYYPSAHPLPVPFPALSGTVTVALSLSDFATC